MSRLTGEQEQFLQRFIKVKVRPRKLFRSDDEKADDKAREAFGDLVELEGEVNGLIGRLNQLPGTAQLVARHREAVQVAHDLKESANDGDPADAERKFRQARAGLELVKKHVITDLDKRSASYQEQRQKYLTARGQVEDLRRKLVAENRAGKGPYEQPLTDLLGEATALVPHGAEDYVSATHLLQRAADLYKTQHQLAKTDREHDLTAARALPVYEDKRERVLAGLTRLQGHRGTRVQQQELQGLLDRAEVLAGQHKYDEAYRALEGLRGKLEDGKKGRDNFRKNVGTAGFRTQLKAAEEQLILYRKLANLADPEFIAEAVGKIDAALRVFDTGVPVAPEAAQAEQDKMQLLATALRQQVTAIQQASEQASTLFKEMDKLVAEIREMAPADVVQPFLDRLLTARALRGSQQYTAALVELNALRLAAWPVRTERKQQVDRWRNLVEEIDGGHRKELAEAVESTNHPVATLGSRLQALLIQAETEVRNTHDYGRAVVLAEQFLEGMVTLRERLLAFREIQEELTAARLAYKEQRQAAADALKDLADQHGDTTDASERLAQLQTAWDQGLAALLTTEGHTVQALRGRILPALEEIRHAARDTLGDPERLQNSVAAATRKADWHKYQETKKAVDEGLDALAVDKPQVAEQLRGDYPDVPAGPEALTPEHLIALTAFKKDRVLVALQGTLTDLKAAATAGERTATELLQILAQLEKTYPAFRVYLDALRDEVEDARGLLHSKVLPIVVQGRDQLANVVRPKVVQVRDENASNAAPLTKNFKAVERKLAALKKQLTDSAALKECLPSQLQALLYRVEKELPAECRKLPPQQALDNVLTRFEADAVVPLLARANDAKLARERLAARVVRLQEQVNQLEEAPRLKASLVNRLKAAAQPGENGEANAKLQLDLIAKQLQAAGDPDTRSQLEQRAGEEEYQAKQAAQAWAGAVRIFEHNTMRRINALRDATPEGQRNEGLLKQIANVFDTAKKAAKAGEFAVANTRLQEANALAERFVVNPLGGRATARNNLRKVNQRWKEAVSKLLRDLNELRQAIKKDYDATGEEARGPVQLDQINATLARAARSFDLTRYDEIIDKVTNPRTTLGEFRMVKEAGLRWVRLNRRVLHTDPVLGHLPGNPFQPQFSLQLLERELNNLELNLLRAP